VVGKTHLFQCSQIEEEVAFSSLQWGTWLMEKLALITVHPLTKTLASANYYLSLCLVIKS